MIMINIDVFDSISVHSITNQANHRREISCFPFQKQEDNHRVSLYWRRKYFFLLAGHKVDFIALLGHQTSHSQNKFFSPC